MTTPWEDAAGDELPRTSMVLFDDLLERAALKAPHIKDELLVLIDADLVEERDLRLRLLLSIVKRYAASQSNDDLLLYNAMRILRELKKCEWGDGRAGRRPHSEQSDGSGELQP